MKYIAFSFLILIHGDLLFAEMNLNGTWDAKWEAGSSTLRINGCSKDGCFYSIDAIGENAHLCNHEGTLKIEGSSVADVFKDSANEQDCRIDFNLDKSAKSLTIKSKWESACSDNCGQGVRFDGTYTLKDKSESKTPTQVLIDKLDVTSFPSSIGPRREKNKIHFSDYGFKLREIRNGAATLETQGEWKFQIRILDRRAGAAWICIEDKALNGGSYHSQTALEFRESSDKKNFSADKGKSGEKRYSKICPEFLK